MFNRMANIALLTACALAIASAQPRVDTARAQTLLSVTITIDAGATGHSIDPKNGLLHGLDGTSPADPDRIAALRPRAWRLGKWESYDMAVRQEDTRVIFGVGTLYRWIHTPAGSRPWEDWVGWENHVRSVLRYIDTRYPTRPPDWIDVWPEPNLPYFWGGTEDQLMELFARTARVMEEHGSEAKIVGPSVSAFLPGAEGLRGLVDFVVELETRHGVRLDAVSWHEFVDYPEGIPGRADHIRSVLSERLPSGQTPELHVNEHLTSSRHLSPGWSIGYTHYLEAADIDVWMRACWSVRSDDLPDPWGGCWAGLNGLLMRDGRTPQPTYWVYEHYAQSAGRTRLPSTSSDLRTVALADRDTTEERVRVMAGRYGRTAPADVKLTLKDWPYAGDRAIARIFRIPQGEGATDRVPRTSPLPGGPVPYGSRFVRVADGEVNIMIPEFEDGDGYIVDVRPAPRVMAPWVGR